MDMQTETADERITRRRAKEQKEAKDLGEILARVRRIETRVTTGLEQLGARVVVTMPVWIEANVAVDIPSLDVRLKDILNVIPPEVSRITCGCCITHKGEWLGRWFGR